MIYVLHVVLCTTNSRYRLFALPTSYCLVLVLLIQLYIVVNKVPGLSYVYKWYHGVYSKQCIDAMSGEKTYLEKGKQETNTAQIKIEEKYKMYASLPVSFGDFLHPTQNHVYPAYEGMYSSWEKDVLISSCAPLLRTNRRLAFECALKRNRQIKRETCKLNRDTEASQKIKVGQLSEIVL